MIARLLTALLSQAKPTAPSPLYGSVQVVREVLGREADMLRIQKILFLAQTIHLGQYRAPLFPESFNASMMGPIIPDLQRSKYSPRLRDPIHRSALNPTKVEVIRSAAHSCQALTSGQLVSLTQRSSGAWARYYSPHPYRSNPYAGYTIPHEEMIREYEAHYSSLAQAGSNLAA